MAHSPAGSSRGGRVVGDYIIGRQIGSGSFSLVWHARHRVRGTEVAVKEIIMERLNKKLQDSLLSEIVILQKITHPNIISLHDIIEVSGRIYLVLEYCRGGDLSMYIQRHGRVLEATAKHFMQQLAAGLQVLRDNDLIHRDLKPQNLLLSSKDDNAVLKIADFGFARSLQPRSLAETMCGSPLYMAPEIMQLQRYNAKADLWSVGAILFQLVTGKTPFTGNSQMQLLQNIMRSSDLRFSSDNNDLSGDCVDLCQRLLCRNPVERITFEEFFNHRFLSPDSLDESLSSSSSRALSKAGDGFLLSECIPERPSEESSQEDCLPFLLDDESSGQGGSPPVAMKKPSVRSTYGFSIDNRVDKIPAFGSSNNIDIPSRYISTHKPENTGSRLSHRPSSPGNLRETTPLDRPVESSSKDPSVVDSLEFIDQDYVIVSGPPLEVSSSSVSASRPHNSPSKLESSPKGSPNNCALSAPMPIIGATLGNIRAIGSLESRSSPLSGTSQGSTYMGDALEQPSSHSLTRIRSLQHCASVITELVNEKIEAGGQLEAFSIQLVILAIWKQALHICHAQAASATEGSPSQDVRARGNTYRSETLDTEECLGSADSQWPDSICSEIERDFLQEVERADELSRDLGSVNETTEMPDALEIIFQCALALGRNGGADELIHNMEGATSLYSKAVQLFYFLLVEAPSLILNPPFSLTNLDCARLRSYIDILNNRQSHSRSQRMALLKCDGQQQSL